MTVGRGDSRRPAQRQLSEMLSIGRPALRQAIRALAVLEVLVIRGDRTRIKSLANIQGGWPANRPLDEVDFDLIELLEVRKRLEPRAVALAGGRATPRH